MRLKRSAKLAAVALVTTAISTSALTAPLGWRKHWEQGQNEWGWGDWGTPNGTGFYVSCPDQPDNGDRAILARIGGDLTAATLSFPNGHHYAVPATGDAFAGIWHDLRANAVMTITSGSKRAVVPIAQARAVMTETVCPM